VEILNVLTSGRFISFSTVSWGLTSLATVSSFHGLSPLCHFVGERGFEGGIHHREQQFKLLLFGKLL